MNATPPDSRFRMLDALWLLVFAVASSTAILAGSARLSATFDEPTYLEQGLQCWRTGSYKGLMRLGTMPLPIDLQTLPIYAYERYQGQPVDLANDFNRYLPLARAGTLVFWWLLLTYGMLIGREFAGPWGGRGVIAVLALEPSLVAHAGLATTDLAVTSLLLMFGYHYARGRDAGWWWRIGLPGVLYGASILAKASGLIFGPILMLAIEAERWFRSAPAATSAGGGGRWQSLWLASGPLRRDAWQIGLLGLAVTFFYIGSDWKPEPSFVKWAQSLPAGSAHDRFTWLAEKLCIFTNAGEGIVQQVKHNLRGHGAFLLDETWRRSVWYYFPVLLSMKLTIPLLIALAVTLIVRPSAHLQWPSLAALLLLLFSVHARVQIGVRLVLPLVALGVIGVTIAVVRWGRDANIFHRTAFLSTVGAALGWLCMTSAQTWPHGLCYVNELWGGPGSGYRLVSDSNYDWGQGLRELEQWAAANRVQRLGIWYFGTDPAARRPPFQFTPIHVTPDATPDKLARELEGSLLAVGTTIRHGAYCQDCEFTKYLNTLEPVDRTQTFLIYRLPGSNLASEEPSRTR